MAIIEVNKLVYVCCHEMRSSHHSKIVNGSVLKLIKAFIPSYIAMNFMESLSNCASSPHVFNFKW